MNVVRYAKWFRERKWSVILFCVEGSPIAKSVNSNDLKVVYVQKNKKYYDVINAIRMVRLLRKNNVSALWLRDTRDLSTIGLAKTFSGNKIKIVYQQAMQLGVSKKDLLHTIRFSKIDAWITLLPFLSNQVKRYTRFNAKKLHTIPLAANINSKKNRLFKNDLRDQFNLPQGSYVLGILGRIAPLKGHLFLVKQLAKLRQKNKDACLLFVGELTRGEGDAYEKLLRETIQELGLEEYVHFRPFMDEVEKFYHAIDLFVMSSQGETFGNVTIEAMTCGVPVLGTNAAGTPEILEQGDLGYLYEVDDEADFIKKTSWIMDNPEEVKEKASKAQQIASHKYHKDVVCDQLEKVIETL